MAYEFPTDIQDRLKVQIEADKLTRWNQRNELAQNQSVQGLSRPLDDEQVLRRLRDRLAEEGILG